MLIITSYAHPRPKSARCSAALASLHVRLHRIHHQHLQWSLMDLHQRQRSHAPWDSARPRAGPRMLHEGRWDVSPFGRVPRVQPAGLSGRTEATESRDDVCGDILLAAVQTMPNCTYVGLLTLLPVSGGMRQVLKLIHWISQPNTGSKTQED
jgi:hypothetical protein